MTDDLQNTGSIPMPTKATATPARVVGEVVHRMLDGLWVTSSRAGAAVAQTRDVHGKVKV